MTGQSLTYSRVHRFMEGWVDLNMLDLLDNLLWEKNWVNPGGGDLMMGSRDDK